MIELALFWTCILATLLGALGAALVRHLLHAGLLLGLCLAGVAGLYLFLHAEYLACIQLVVYVGGILVLILFATLFSGDIRGTVQRTPGWLRWTGMAAAALTALVAGRIAMAVRLDAGASAASAASAAGPAPDHLAAGALGNLLAGPWLVPFLAAGLLLTVVLVGAVATVLRHQGGKRGA